MLDYNRAAFIIGAREPSLRTPIQGDIEALKQA